MVHRFAKWFAPILVLFLLAACQGQATPVHQTDQTPAVINATATSQTSTASPLPSTTPEPSSSVEPTLPPIQATLQALSAAVTLAPSQNSAQETRIAPDDYVRLVDQACRIVQDNYVRDNFNGVDWPATCQQYREMAQNVDSQEAFWDLMERFIGELNDNHSRFVRPDRFDVEFDLPSEGAGIPWPGLDIYRAREADWLSLWNVCRFGPAADAGLQRGDVILAINGQPVTRPEDGFEYRAIYQQIYSKGDSVTLTVQQGPDAKPTDITVPFGGAGGCDSWQVGLVSETPRIGYIRIPSFAGDADFNLLQAIKEMEAERPLDGLVLDVRENPGGNADSSIAIFTSGTFGKVGPLRQDATQTIYRIRGPVRWNETTPVAVLTDGGSHSAAEYFATAMQQSGRATLVGMPTAGNTEGITGFNLADGSLIRLAVQTLILPDGSTLEGTGVVPDVAVPLGKWGLLEQPDAQLAAALDVLTSQIAQP